MSVYHKIDTLFVRDVKGSKKLIKGQYRNDVVFYLKDLPWLFTEKIDGTNIRVEWDGHRVSFGGRTDNAQIPAMLLNDTLFPRFNGPENEDLFEQKFGETSVTLYGEGFGSRIQKEGGNYRDGTDFALFDVKVGNTFLSRESVEDVGKYFGIFVVPIVLESSLPEAVEYIEGNPKSVVAWKPRPMEGIIGIPKVRLFDHRSERIIVKIKCEDF